MEQKKYEIMYEEEKTLIDLIKLFVKNRFYILKVTGFVFLLGMGAFFTYSKVKPLQMEQKFYLSYIDRMEEMEIGGVPINPELLFKDNQFIDMFFEKEFIKSSFQGTSDSEKRGYVLSKLGMKIEKLKTDRFIYTLTTKGKTLEENKMWAKAYFEILNVYIEKQNRAKLDKEYQLLDKKASQYKSNLQDIEERIRILVKEEKSQMNSATVSIAEEIREKNPGIFSEKDSYSVLYGDVLSKKENLSQFLDFLDLNFEYRSSLVESKGKINFSIAFILSLTGGFLLGLILVLGKNYFKNINWE